MGSHYAELVPNNLQRGEGGLARFSHCYISECCLVLHSKMISEATTVHLVPY